MDQQNYRISNSLARPTLIGLEIKLARPADRERPCCRNICIIRAGREPHAGALICTDCGQHRGWLSKPTARWIEHVATRFGAPPTPIVVRKSHTYQEEAPTNTQNSQPTSNPQTKRTAP